MIQLLREGLIITVVGMGLVFAALALLWGVMAAMHRLFPPGEKPFASLWRRWRGQAAAPAAEEAVAAAPVAEAEAGLSEAELAAVMTALALWQEERAAEAAIRWRLPPVLTRWMAVGRSRQLQSWSPRR